MDAAGSSRSSKKRRSSAASRHPLQEVGSGAVYIPPMAATGLPFNNPLTDKRSGGGDRFIPNRSAMDLNMAHYLLTETRRVKENTAPMSPAKDTYRRALADTLMPNRGRILAFRSKPPLHAKGIFHDLVSDDSVAHQAKHVKPRRHIPQSAERTLDAPEFLDDYYLNLLDWGSSNVLSIALGNTVYLWNAFDGSTSELVTLDEDRGLVASVSWAPDGQHIAVGLNSSDIQLWDSSSNRLTAKVNQGNIALKRVVESIANGDSRVPFRITNSQCCYM